MADFLSRLAERTLGIAPVVRPLIPPRFAPETAPYPLDLEWDVDAPPPDEPEETRPPRTREAPSHLNTPARRTNTTAIGRREDRSVAPPQPEETPPTPDAPHSRYAPQPESLHHPQPESVPAASPPLPAAEPEDADRPSAENRGAPQETDTRSMASGERRQAPNTAPERTGEPVEVASSEEEEALPVARGSLLQTVGTPRATRPEAPHSREADDERGEGHAPAPRREAALGSPLAPAERAPTRGAYYPEDPAVEVAERVRSLPRVVPKRGEVPASGASAHTGAMPEPSPPVSRTVGDAAQARRGAPGSLQPEVSPIMVRIGRVEVRAVQPASPPPRREAAPPAGLSLDDYLRSRDGERR